MGRIIFDTATSANGWIADQRGSLQWLFDVPHTDQDMADLAPPDTPVLVMGATTYEWVLAEEELLTNPAKWQQFYAGKTVFVFSTRELPAPEGADVRIVGGSVPEVLPSIRETAADADIWVVGGGDLAGQFLDAGVLDQVRLSIAPVFLAGGAPLLPRDVRSDVLHLVSARSVGAFVRVVYEVR